MTDSIKDSGWSLLASLYQVALWAMGDALVRIAFLGEVLGELPRSELSVTCAIQRTHIAAMRAARRTLYLRRELQARIAEATASQVESPWECGCSQVKWQKCYRCNGKGTCTGRGSCDGGKVAQYLHGTMDVHSACHKEAKGTQADGCPCVYHIWDAYIASLDDYRNLASIAASEQATWDAKSDAQRDAELDSQHPNDRAMSYAFGNSDADPEVRLVRRLAKDGNLDALAWLACFASDSNGNPQGCEKSWKKLQKLGNARDASRAAIRAAARARSYRFNVLGKDDASMMPEVVKPPMRHNCAARKRQKPRWQWVDLASRSGARVWAFVGSWRVYASASDCPACLYLRRENPAVSPAMVPVSIGPIGAPTLAADTVTAKGGKRRMSGSVATDGNGASPGHSLSGRGEMRYGMGA